VKDLLLSMSDLQTLNEAISQAVKCDNRLFQRRQDQCSWNSLKYSYLYFVASTTISSLQSGAEDIQIDAVRYNHSLHKRSVVLMEACICTVEKMVIRPINAQRSNIAILSK
jgi:hypothetical protein